MRVNKRREGKELRVENLDDLWHLTHLVDEGDVVFAWTRRRLDDRGVLVRPEDRKRIPLRLGIRVERVVWHKYSDHLRISGRVEHGPEELMRAHHTLNVGVGDSVTVAKPRWKRRHLDRIKEAVAGAQRPVVVCVAMDEEEAAIALIRQYGPQPLATVQSHQPGKQYPGGSREKEYFGQIYAVIDQHPGLPLVVVGPGFVKERFYRWLQRDHPRQGVVDSTGQAGMSGIGEALKRGIVERIAREQRAAHEIRMVERLLEEIAKGGLVTYGVEETKHAIDAGAVQILLITDEFVRSQQGERLLEGVRATGGRFLVVSTLHDAGQQLRSLGGAGVLLRFRIN